MWWPMETVFVINSCQAVFIKYTSTRVEANKPLILHSTLHNSHNKLLKRCWLTSHNTQPKMLSHKPHRYSKVLSHKPHHHYTKVLANKPQKSPQAPPSHNKLQNGIWGKTLKLCKPRKGRKQSISPVLRSCVDAATWIVWRWRETEKRGKKGVCALSMSCCS